VKTLRPLALGLGLIVIGAGMTRGEDGLRPTFRPPIPDRIVLDPVDPARVWRAIRPALAKGRRPELVDQLLAVFTDPNPSRTTTGWYRGGKSRYGWAWLAGRFDADRDGVVTAGEFGASDHAEAWKALDRDRDGKVSPDDLDWSDRSPWARNARQVSSRFSQIDADTDGRISAGEWQKYFRAASKGKDEMTLDDFRDHMAPDPERRPVFSFEYRMARAKVILNGDIGSMFEGPGVGELAPDFTLETLQGSRPHTLSASSGKRPVVLIFGNYTCPPHRSETGVLEQLYRRYGGRVDFLRVYVREAHPVDGWRNQVNDRAGIHVSQPVDQAGRRAMAERCSAELKLTMPMVVDSIDDAVGHAYSGMPERLYVIDHEGMVAYKGGRGPFGFLPGEMEQSLAMLLLDRAGPVRP
jgi:thiol-disulfide isomerase/thioredoxin